MQNMKNILCLLLSLCLVLSFFPAAFADGSIEPAYPEPAEEQGTITPATEGTADPDTVQGVPAADEIQASSGSCGENLTWTLDDEGTLTISGTGKMDDYEMEHAVTTAPWGELMPSVERLVVEEGVTSIGNYAFVYNVSAVWMDGTTVRLNALREASFASTVRTIGNKAFAGTQLTSLVLPEGVREVGGDAFSDTYLSSVKIPASLRTVGPYVFYLCDKLTSAGPTGSGCAIEFAWTSTFPKLALSGSAIESVIFPEGVRTIGAGAFSNCEALKSVTIPEKVTALQDSTFESCKNLTEVILNSNLKSLGQHAFAGCTGLTSMEIPEGVETIGSDAFENCSNLAQITIPDSVTSFGGGAFENCSSLQSITIPKNLTNLYEGAFRGCSSLEQFQVREGNSSIFADERGVLFKTEWAESILLATPCSLSGSYEVPEGTLRVANYAFENRSELTAVTLPTDLNSMGEYAFAGCTQLTEITVPAVNNGLSSHAFAGCTALERVTLAHGLTGIGGSAFLDCAALHEIAIPVTVTEIGDSAFYNCEQISNVYYSGTEDQWYEVQIGMRNEELDYAEFHFAEAGDIVASGPCGKEGDNLIWELDNLGTLTISGTGEMADYSYEENSAPWMDRLDQIESWVISDGVTSIGSDAFSRIDKLEEIRIPDSVVRIGEDAFLSDKKLREINIPGSVRSIGDRAFESCTGLCELHIADGVESIGEYAFAWCSSLAEVSIADSVKEIGYNAFYDCRALTELVIPGSVKKMDGAFVNCGALERVILLDGVESIGSSTFQDCVNLEKVVIPASVTGKVFKAFKGCELLLSAGPIDSGCNIEFGWTDRIPDEVLSDSEILSVTIPEGVTSIGSAAFFNSQSLKEVKLPESLLSIENCAFQDCPGLCEIDIPDSVTQIGGFSFAYCSSLESIRIPSSVTSIGWNAFAGCESLKEIRFVGSAPELGATPFSGVTAVAYYPGNDSSWTEEVRQGYGGTITWIAEMPAYVPGDINGDGGLDNKDVTRLIRYIKYHDIEANEAALDVNGDGALDNKDVTRLIRYIKYGDVEIF